MNGDTTMDWAGYWDESEFNFFKTLEDDDKLMYIYDLCLGEFDAEWISDEEENDIHKSMEDALRAMGEHFEEEEPQQSFRNQIKVSMGIDDLKIEGPTLDVILKVAQDMQWNGLMLTDRQVEFTKYEPWNVILSYKISGQGLPISLN